MVITNDKYHLFRKFPQLFATLSVGIGSFCLGVVTGWTGNNSIDIQNGGLNGIIVDDFQLGWIGSLINLGGMVSCLLTGSLCDWIGRKWTLLSLVFPNILGWLLIIFAQNVEMIYSGRFFCGLSSGAFLMYGAMYVSEIVEKDVRGIMGVLGTVMLIPGVFTGFVFGYFMNAKNSAIASIIFPIVFGLCFIQQPESPYYKLKRGEKDEATKILRKLRGSTCDVEKEIEIISAQLKEDEIKISLLEIFKRRDTRIATLIGFGLMFFQQATGLNAVTYYTSTIFKSAGIDESVLSSELSTLIVGFIQLVGSILAIIVSGKFNSRYLLALSGLFMSISLFVFAIYFTLLERNLVEAEILSTIGFIPLTSLCVFILSSVMAYGPLAFVVTVEVSPSDAKSIITTMAATFNWFVAFLVTKFYLDLKNILGGDVVFYIFGGVAVCSAIFPLVFVPETRGKTFGEIHNELKGN